MPDGEAIAIRVTRVLEQIPDQARRLGLDANGGWALLIKTHLAQLGDELAYEVRTSGTVPRTQRAAMAGLRVGLGLAETGPGRHGDRARPLVLDSEWHSSRDEQMDDFQELLSTPADLRVMVFRQCKATAVQALMDDLERQAKARDAAGRGALCLLCGYDWEDTQRFAFRTFAA